MKKPTRHQIETDWKKLTKDRENMEKEQKRKREDRVDIEQSTHPRRDKRIIRSRENKSSIEQKLT